MIRESFNDNWVFRKGNLSMMDLFLAGEETAEYVTLPHDAMIQEERVADTPNANQTGFYPGGLYTYIKKWQVPNDWQGRSVTLEFEGVAGLSRVYINGDYAGGSLNSYRGFYVPVEKYLLFGQENEVKVEVNNPEQSSRWYSGSGIYRNVNVLTGGPVRLAADGVEVTTPDVEKDSASVVVKTCLVNSGMENRKVRIRTRLWDEQGNPAGEDCIPVTAYGQERFVLRQRLAVKNPLLWDDVHPHLYVCEVQVLEADKEQALAGDGEQVLDRERLSIGIRKLSLSAKEGLLVNGRAVKLRGTCLHHDNGILGAVTLPRAEERRCEQLKAAGFNCIRSSHHPMSRAMLDACDRLGIYVMDELWDMWTRTKNPNDYACVFQGQWEQDVESMVKKDFNHPCVIFYSLGNEIQEAGTAAGAAWNRRINNKVKELDDTRYTTNAVNGLLAGNSRMGEIMGGVLAGMNIAPQAFAETEEKEQQRGFAEMEEQVQRGFAETDEQTQQPALSAEGETAGNGADELNGMMSIMMGPVADGMATSPVLMEMIDEFVSVTDIAGYNYLTALHEAESQLHPNRVVLGTETFPADIVRLWDIVKRCPHVIGDMTWTGYDYLGEAGCGIFHYDGVQNFTAHWPERLAYIGDIDLTGYRRPISYLRQIVYGLRQEPYIAVQRMDKNGQKCSRTPWMWKDNIASWTWPGYEGRTALVDVCAKGQETELFLNGRSLGRKAVTDYTASFEVPYEAGILKAVSYEGGKETGSFELRTAGPVTSLKVEADRKELVADGADLCYLTVFLADEEGHVNLREIKKVTVTVEGAGTLQGMGSADPQTLTSYQDNCWETYDGCLLAAVRAGKGPGSIEIKVEAPGCRTQRVSVKVTGQAKEGKR